MDFEILEDLGITIKTVNELQKKIDNLLFNETKEIIKCEAFKGLFLKPHFTGSTQLIPLSPLIGQMKPRFCGVLNSLEKMGKQGFHRFAEEFIIGQRFI